MNYPQVTREEFEKTVWAYYPHKHMSIFQHHGRLTVCALDTHGETQLSQYNQILKASYLWQDGLVLTDDKGIFSHFPTLSTVSPTVTLPSAQSNMNRTTITNNSTGPITYSIPTGGIWHVSGSFGTLTFPGDLSIDIDIDKIPHSSSNKCECGSHSVGSNRHSSWCPIKEEV